MKRVIFAVALIGAVAASRSEPRAGAPVALVRLPAGGIQPQAAVDDRGVAHVVYFQGEPAHGDLFYVSLGRDGRFTRPLQVNSHAGSAMATGTMRGGHLAIGRGGRVHVAWHGSDAAEPKAAAGSTPVLYARMNDAHTAFEAERNVVQSRLTGLDGGTVAAGGDGGVYVAWHAFVPGMRGELDRRVWLARSADDGRTFSVEAPVSDASTGACGCCSVGAVADRQGGVFLLYRAATESVHRDTYALVSHDRGERFTGRKLQDWNINACPMSTFSLASRDRDVVAAWETDGQVQWTRLDSAPETTGVIAPPGAPKTRKHPAIAVNARGETLLVWTEGTGWNKGGSLAWQLFDRAGATIGAEGQASGVPTWGLASVAARSDGSFVIVY